jgi:tripartite-type tricarboxylate transporter receptor subunit TctC
VVGEALRQPSVLEVFRVQAAVPVTSSPEEMRAFIAADRERWNAVVRDLNIRLE